jgi:hypothetical protein
LDFYILPYGSQLALFNLQLQTYCDKTRHMGPFAAKEEREEADA